MRCSAAKKLISDYIDDNLKAEKRSSLKGHLEACQDCSHFLKDFQQIVKNAKELKEISPSEQAWTKLRQKLETEGKQALEFKPRRKEWAGFNLYSPKLKYALSSALLLAFIAGVLTVGLRYWGSKNIMGKEAFQKYTLAKLDEAEHHYQLAIKALGDAVSAQEDNMDPQIAGIFRKNLEIIDSSIMACRQMILREPDDLEARNYLLAAYKGKVDFLNGMIEMKTVPSQKKESETTI